MKSYGNVATVLFGKLVDVRPFVAVVPLQVTRRSTCNEMQTSMIYAFYIVALT